MPRPFTLKPPDARHQTWWVRGTIPVSGERFQRTTGELEKAEAASPQAHIGILITVVPEAAWLRHAPASHGLDRGAPIRLGPTDRMLSIVVVAIDAAATFLKGGNDTYYHAGGSAPSLEIDKWRDGGSPE